jgi:hypothetical protein
MATNIQVVFYSMPLQAQSPSCPAWDDPACAWNPQMVANRGGVALTAKGQNLCQELHGQTVRHQGHAFGLQVQIPLPSFLGASS